MFVPIFFFYANSRLRVQTLRRGQPFIAWQGVMRAGFRRTCGCKGAQAGMPALLTSRRCWMADREIGVPGGRMAAKSTGNACATGAAIGIF